jgi:hypothetical protein
MNLLPVLTAVVILGGILYLFIRRNNERTANAPLRSEIRAQVRFATTLDHVSIFGTGGLGGTRGQWIRLRGPKRLVVGADAFMVTLPQARREFVFPGREAAIRYSQEPSRLAPHDWIVITGQLRGRMVQLAITKNAGLPEIWQALVGTGAAQGTEQVTG